jgi:tetratricopeptide (TPR) repeat protein
VLIEGEAGIGKTRLLEGLIALAHASGTTVFRGEGHPLERTRPFGVLVDALGLRGASPDLHGAALRRLLTGEVSSEADQFADNQLQFRAIEEIIDMIEVASDRGPVLVALDDLHWADSSTLLAFRWMVRELTEVPLMLVAALRLMPRGPELAALVDDCLAGGAELIELEPLDVDEVAALVRAELGVPAGAELTAVVGRAAGNPLWVVETVRTMASRGLLDLSGPTAETASVELPDSLRRLVVRRLGYLSEATARTLRSASLLGDSFSLADLATITERRAAELLEGLTEAIDAGLVAARAGLFVFRHQLVRDAIYEDVPEGARIALHREAAAALEAAGAPLTQVASQLIRGAVAGDVRAAASLRRAAGDAAPRAPAIAAELLRRAVSLLPDDDPERDVMQTELIEALLGAGENVQAAALASELLARPHDPALAGRLRFVLIVVLSLQGGDERLDLEVEAVLRESPDMPPGPQARLLGHSSFGRTFSGDFSGAERVARHALEIAERGADDAMPVWTMCALSNALMAQGRIDEALTILRDALRRARQAPGGMDRMGNPRFLAGMFFTDADLFDEASQLLREAGAECETTPSSATTLPDVHLAAAQLRFVAGEWSEVVPELEGGIEFARARGNMVLLGRARSYLALALRRADARVRAVELDVLALGPELDLDPTPSGTSG